MATTPRVIANKQTCRVSRAHHIISRGGKCHRSSGLDHKLVELIKIRVPQINGCPFCLRMHTRDALKLGESTDRIAVLPAWAETGYFSETDRAALGLAESITRVSDGHVSDEDYDTAAAVLTADQISAVTWLATLMNAFNRIAITSRYRVTG